MFAIACALNALGWGVAAHRNIRFPLVHRLGLGIPAQAEPGNEKKCCAARGYVGRLGVCRCWRIECARGCGGVAAHRNIGTMDRLPFSQGGTVWGGETRTGHSATHFVATCAGIPRPSQGTSGKWVALRPARNAHTPLAPRRSRDRNGHAGWIVLASAAPAVRIGAKVQAKSHFREKSAHCASRRRADFVLCV